MNVATLALSLVSLLVSLLALDYALGVRRRDVVRPRELARYRDPRVWPPEGRTDRFPDAPGSPRPPWEGGPRC